MNRRVAANIIGCLGILCSIGFWIEVAVTRVTGATPHLLDMGLDGWIACWALGLVLALLAATLGSRRWAFGALLPLASFLAVIAATDWKSIQW
jgi:hypothetical protein